MLRRFSLSLMAAILLLTGCDYEFNEIFPTYALPILNSKLSVYNLLAKQDSNRVNIGQDGLVTVIYRNELLRLPADQIVSLPNQNETFDAVYNGTSIPNFPAGQTVSINGNVQLDFSSPDVLELYKLLLFQGSLSVNMTSNLQHDISYTLFLDDLTVNGSAVQLSGNSTFNGGNHNQVQNRDLANALIDLSQNNTTYNKLRVRYEMTVTSKGGPLTQGDKVTFGVNVSRMVFQQVDCYLRNTTLPLAADSVELDLFQFTNESQTPSGGTFALTDPRIVLSFTNGLYLPLSMDIRQLQVKERSTGAVSNILLSSFQNPFSIASPIFPGPPMATEILINNSNSNLRDVITPTKKVMLFQVDALPNPAGKTVNRLVRGTSLNVDAGVELPLIGYGYNWILGDTVELGLKLGEQENLKSGILRLNLENRFPVDVTMQIYFLDDMKQVKDSLFAGMEDFVKSGILDASGKVIAASKTIKDIPADNQKLKNISASKYIAMRAGLQTKDGQSKRDIKIFGDYDIKIQLGIKAEVSYNP